LDLKPIILGPKIVTTLFYPRLARIAFTATGALTATCSHRRRREVGSPAGVILAGQ
jgi:hypothetical protein